MKMICIVGMISTKKYKHIFDSFVEGAILRLWIMQVIHDLLTSLEMMLLVSYV